jgi:hypothetical protein
MDDSTEGYKAAIDALSSRKTTARNRGVFDAYGESGLAGKENAVEWNGINDWVVGCRSRLISLAIAKTRGRICRQPTWFDQTSSQE